MSDLLGFNSSKFKSILTCNSAKASNTGDNDKNAPAKSTEAKVALTLTLKGEKHSIVFDELGNVYDYDATNDNWTTREDGEVVVYTDEDGQADIQTGQKTIDLSTVDVKTKTLNVGTADVKTEILDEGSVLSDYNFVSQTNTGNTGNTDNGGNGGNGGTVDSDDEYVVAVIDDFTNEEDLGMTHGEVIEAILEKDNDDNDSSNDVTVKEFDCTDEESGDITLPKLIEQLQEIARRVAKGEDIDAVNLSLGFAVTLEELGITEFTIEDIKNNTVDVIAALKSIYMDKLAGMSHPVIPTAAEPVITVSEDGKTKTTVTQTVDPITGEITTTTTVEITENIIETETIDLTPYTKAEGVKAEIIKILNRIVPSETATTDVNEVNILLDKLIGFLMNDAGNLSDSDIINQVKAMQNAMKLNGNLRTYFSDTDLANVKGLLNNIDIETAIEKKYGVTDVKFEGTATTITVFYSKDETFNKLQKTLNALLGKGRNNEEDEDDHGTIYFPGQDHSGYVSFPGQSGTTWTSNDWSTTISFSSYNENENREKVDRYLDLYRGRLNSCNSLIDQLEDAGDTTSKLYTDAQKLLAILKRDVQILSNLEYSGYDGLHNIMYNGSHRTVTLASLRDLDMTSATPTLQANLKAQATASSLICDATTGAFYNSTVDEARTAAKAKMDAIVDFLKKNSTTSGTKSTMSKSVYETINRMIQELSGLQTEIGNYNYSPLEEDQDGTAKALQEFVSYAYSCTSLGCYGDGWTANYMTKLEESAKDFVTAGGSHTGEKIINTEKKYADIVNQTITAETEVNTTTNSETVPNPNAQFTENEQTAFYLAEIIGQINDLAASGVEIYISSGNDANTVYFEAADAGYDAELDVNKNGSITGEELGVFNIFTLANNANVNVIGALDATTGETEEYSNDNGLVDEERSGDVNATYLGDGNWDLDNDEKVDINTDYSPSDAVVGTRYRINFGTSFAAPKAAANKDGE